MARSEERERTERDRHRSDRFEAARGQAGHASALRAGGSQGRTRAHTDGRAATSCALPHFSLHLQTSPKPQALEHLNLHSEG